MLAVFEKDYFLRTSDFDCKGRLKPSSVLELFQNVAGEHATVLGAAGNTHARSGLAPAKCVKGTVPFWRIFSTFPRILGGPS